MKVAMQVSRKGFLKFQLFRMLTAFSMLLVYGQQLVFADDELQYQVEPITYLINFHVDGILDGATDAGIPYYTMSGPGYAPKEIFSSGEVSDSIEKDQPIAQLSGAKIVFSGAPTDPIVNFTCLPGSCNLKLKDGAELVSNAGLALEGRAINMWGPVVNSPDYSFEGGIMPIRIAGCGGLKEVAGKGRVANMVGTICFNGVLNFNVNDQRVLTGSSKCTVTLHTPADPTIIP